MRNAMLEYYEDEVPIKRSGSRMKWDRTRLPGGRNWKNADFQCMVCHHYVSAAAVFAGVQNRNHCPYCLWSKHLDLQKPGDRMAVCKAGMRPVALTLKQARKKYTHPYQGELMIVHHCDLCGKNSINRVASDDDPERILSVFQASPGLDETLRRSLSAEGIVILAESERWVVVARLFGNMEPALMGDRIQAMCE